MSLTRLTVCSLTLGLALFAVGCDSPAIDHTHADARGANPMYMPGTPGTAVPGAGASPIPASSSDCPLAFPKHQVCAEIVWDSQPTQGKNSPFTLHFWTMGQGTAAGPFVDPPHDVGVKLWMPDMGHGSSPVTVTHASPTDGGPDAGTFHAEAVYFIMPGKWEIHVQLLHGTEVHEEAIEVVRI